MNNSVGPDLERNIDALCIYHANIMIEVASLADDATRKLRRAGLPVSRSSRRHVESAALSMRKICEYLAVAVVFAHHWEGNAAIDLMAWRPKDLLTDVGKLSDHPTPAPLEPFQAAGNLVPTARPVGSAQIAKVYGQLSNLLHVGSPNRIVQANFPPFDLDRLMGVSDAFQRLANAHVIALPNVKRVLIWNGPTRSALLGEGDGEAVFNFDHLPQLELSVYE